MKCKTHISMWNLNRRKESACLMHDDHGKIPTTYFVLKMLFSIDYPHHVCFSVNSIRENSPIWLQTLISFPAHLVSFCFVIQSINLTRIVLVSVTFCSSMFSLSSVRCFFFSLTLIHLFFFCFIFILFHFIQTNQTICLH